MFHSFSNIFVLRLWKFIRLMGGHLYTSHRTLLTSLADVLVLLSSSIIDWNNPLIINKMFKVYLGDVPLKTKVCRLSVLTFKHHWV